MSPAGPHPDGAHPAGAHPDGAHPDSAHPDSAHPDSAHPDSATFADGCAALRAAYVHIPFCARICPYCDFAVVEGRDDAVQAYVDSLCAEIDEAATAAPSSGFGPLDAVFIGGGTPSHVEPDLVGSVMDRLRDGFGLASSPEITMEANPEDWSVARAEKLRSVGVNRVSFGAQSLQPSTLDYLGRRHRPEDVMLAVGRSRDAGFDSVGVDLIFGAPGEPLAAWIDTIEQVTNIDPDHVSAYSLTVERGTPLSRAVNSGAPAPDPDDAADAYGAALDRLAAAGYVHYEVSNWARPGHACRYNMAVWAQGEYLAFGVGAHRHVAGERSWNIRKLDVYLGRGGLDVVASRERLDPAGREVERVLIGLRRRAGVRAGELGQRWAASEGFDRLRSAGIADLVHGRIVVTDPLRTDTAGRMLLAFAESANDGPAGADSPAPLPRPADENRESP